MRTYSFGPWLMFTTLFVTAPVVAGNAEVVDAVARCQQQICRFDVALKHGDEGWDHYANQWQVITASGEVIGTRTLHHPHVNEQPFTRSLGSVKIPNGEVEVFIVPRDSVHGEGAGYPVKLN